MSGSGHREPDKITDKVRDEILATLRLLFRQVDQHAVSLDLDPRLTIYLTDLPTDVNNVPIPEIQPAVWEGVHHWNVPVKRQPLIVDEAKVGKGGGVEFEPVPCHEPVFSEVGFDTHGVSFASMAVRESKAMPLGLPMTSDHAVPPALSRKPAVASVAVGAISTRTQKRIAKIQTAARTTTKFYLSPIKKTAIQPNRFAPAIREKFRQVLAERAKTRPANIQLFVVFERMHANFYSSITPDDHGNLLCTPKEEVVGKNQGVSKEGAKKESPVAYLVVGLRLDTKEDVRALVPASVLEEFR